MMIEIQHMAHDVNLKLKSISRSETVHCFLPTQPGAGKFRRKEEIGDEILKRLEGGGPQRDDKQEVKRERNDR